MVAQIGYHIIADLYDCTHNRLDDLQFVELEMENAAISAGANIVCSKFHKFAPIGISGVVIISESHLTIHTWPEFKYAAVDVFTCGNEGIPNKAINYLIEAFNCKNPKLKELTRGDAKLLSIY